MNEDDPMLGGQALTSSRRVSRRKFLWLGSGVLAAMAFILNELKPGVTPPGGHPLIAGQSSPSATGPAAAGLRGLPAAPEEVEYPVTPYISKSFHLDALPWPAQSFYRQPWRGYLETVSGQQFLEGIGVNYNLLGNANHDAVMKLLSDSGFRWIRLEFGWGAVAWSESTFTNSATIQRILVAARRHGVKPLILLNANQGAPVPYQAYARRVLAGGTVGSRQLRLDDVSGLVPGYSGLSNLTRAWMAEVLFTSIDAGTSTVQLSKPLPKPIPNGSAVSINTLKYLPLYPTGTTQFEQTAAGWLRYVDLVMQQLAMAGFSRADLEMWNELSFGSQFLSINFYYSPDIAQFTHDFLRQGGQGWELARRTIEHIGPRYPGSRVIWGFSNTTFYHTPVPGLPAGTNGQSYHPYGTGKRLIPRDFPPISRYPWFIEHFIPNGLSWCMPEGWAHLGVQTEFLPRLLNPATRLTNLPQGTEAFQHHMTEHGFNPREVGIADRQQALSYKAKSAIRALLFWLNKGLTRLDIYSAYDRSDLGYGMLYALPNPSSYGGYVEQQLISPALQAIRNVVNQFGGAQPLRQVRQLGADVASLGRQTKIFDGGGGHPPLYYREMFTFLPFQVSPHKFVCAVYLMCYDITAPPPAMGFRIRVHNVAGSARASYYDPIANQPMPVAVIERGANEIRVQFEAVEYPRLLIIEE